MAVAPCIITWWPTLTTTEGELDTKHTWDSLFEAFSKRRPFMGCAHPGWSPAEFDPCKRGLENVQRIFALCLDYDGGTTIDEARERWAGTFGFIHTSRSHTHDEPRFRVILPLSRAVSPFEFGLLWKRLAEKAGDIDQAPKDPSRFWYVPGAKDGHPFEAHRLEGAPLHVERWLTQPEEPRRAPAPVSPTATDVEKRAIAYIDKMPDAISGSGGHQATWNVALVLARGFGLSEGATLRILRDHYNHRCRPPWREKELEHKARNAVNADRVPLGYLLDDDRGGWDASRYPEPEPQEAPPFDAPIPEDGPLGFAHPEPRQRGERQRIEPVKDERPVAERFGLLSMRDLMEGVVEELNKGKPKPGISTGSADMNAAMGGFRPGLVTVFGAKRGWGKTSYGNLVVSGAVPEHRVLMFAGEDAATIYGRRFLAMRANLNAMLLRDYQCDKSDWPRIVKAVADAPPNPFFVRVEGRPVEWMAEVIQAVAEEHGGLDLVIVDYLQCLKSGRKHQDRRNEVTYVSSTLSNAIKRVNAAGLMFSQLKRTEREEPEVEDLKESGDIEDMADHIMLGWKIPGRTGQQAERKLKLGKNKDGVEASEIDAISMRWNNRTASFEWTPSQARDAAPADPYGYDGPDDFSDEDWAR